jgi:hypothetical protein
LAIIGFLMLLAWVPTEVPEMRAILGSQAYIYSAHKAEISAATISIGLAIALAGVLAQGFTMAFEALRPVRGGSLNPSYTEKNRGTSHPPVTKSLLPLIAGDKIKIYKGYEVLKAENGVSVSERNFKGLLDAEKWINEQGR